MLLRLILSIFALLPAALHQNATRKITHPDGKPVAMPRTAIDNITTTAQAQQFVLSSSEQYQNFVLAETPKIHDNQFLLQSGNGGQTNCMEQLKCIDIKSIRNWVKADFDGNGQTDLLVWGSFSKYAKPVTACFLDVGPQNIQTQVLSKRNLVCDVMTVVQVRKKPALQCAHLTFTRQPGTHLLKGPFCRLDTIIHDGAGFIEYNSHPKDHKIQQVRLSVSKCYGRCPVYTVEINNNRKAVYQAIANNKKQGAFTAFLDINTVQNLYHLLNYVRFPDLEDNTRSVNVDMSTYKLTITYAGGKQKIIGGDGYTEHLGLQRVYKMLADIKNQQDQQ